MNDGQEYSGSKNPMMVAAGVLLVAALIWAIVATTMAVKRGGELEQKRAEFNGLKVQFEQQAANIQAREADADRRVQEAEQLRKTALEWTRQSQQRIQELEKQKASMKAGPAMGKKTGTSSSKSSATGKKATSSTSKKSSVKKPSH